MAISNYTDLQNSVADWLNRQDLTSQIPDFISFAEARFNRTLRSREMITRRQTDTTNEFIKLPFDFLEPYQLTTPSIQTSAYNMPFTFIGPDEAARLKAAGITGNSRYYTILDTEIEIIPSPSSSVDLTLTYYAQIPPLASNTTNWLLQKAPDLYLYTTLTNAAPYLANDERIPVWATLAQNALDELTLASERATRSRTSLTARRRGF